MIHRIGRIGFFSLILGLSVMLMPIPAQSVDLAGGKTAFETAPRLLSTFSTDPSSNAQAIYYFKIQVPADAGEPLKALRIEQLDMIETVHLSGNDTKAFRGQHFAQENALSLSAIGGPDQPDKITVIFEHPIKPGQTFTVGIVPQFNPSQGGLYQFRVMAFPDGNDGIGFPLGIGRVNLYSN